MIQFPNNRRGKIATTDHGIIPSKGQMLKSATIKIGELERDREKLVNMNAWLLVSVQALGRHANLSPQEAKKVVDDFIAMREMEELEKTKASFKEKLTKGEMPEFKIIDRRDEPPPVKEG